MCRYCLNSSCDDELRPWNDLSYHTLLFTSDARILMRSGDGRPTVIMMDKFYKGTWHDFGYVDIKFCPFCGRELVENKKDF